MATTPTADQLKALAHGLVAQTSHELFPLKAPARPRLFASTDAFMTRFQDHRRLDSHNGIECPGCLGVQVLIAFVRRCLNQAIARGDVDTEAVLRRVDARLVQAWDSAIV